jgi:uncharacterized protein YndB with AHSA1/START domain
MTHEPKEGRPHASEWEGTILPKQTTKQKDNIMQKPKLVYSTFIRTTPKKLWDAITEPKFTRQYWGGFANASDWKKGSEWKHLNPDKEVWITGKVLECKAPKRLVLSWADPEKLAEKSRVTFEIEQIEDMTCLTVAHDNLKPGSRMLRGVSWGWPRVISSMKTFLETGKGLNIFAGR